MAIYKGMLEASVLTISDKGEPVVPYFNNNQITNYLNEYLDQNISRYTTHYRFETAYSYPKSDSLCSSMCRKLSIRLVAKINLFYDYDKTQIFTVRSSEEL